MRMMRTFCLVLVLLAACPAVAGETIKTKPKIAVLALKAATGIDEATVRLLDEFLLTEVQEAGGFEVLGSSDIASMMSLEEQRVQLTGCSDDSCLVEIGGVLGVNLLLASSVGAVGNRLLLNVKLLDVSTARVLKRTSEVMDNDQARLIDAIKRAVGKVMPGLAVHHMDDLPAVQPVSGATGRSPLPAENQGPVPVR